ncbi:MAG: DMT family transporter [Pseudomonadota bacterium]
MTLTDNAKGALWMSASMAGFVVNDALMKTVSDDLPLFQIIFIRGLFASVLIILFAWARGALRFGFAVRDRKLVGWRLLSEVLSTVLFLTALFNMPLANAVAIIQAATLSVALCAAWFLGEQVGWRRYTAIVIGFAGVLLIVRPLGADFNIYALAALAAVASITLRDLMTRQISRGVPGLAVTVLTSLTITTMGGIGTTFSDSVPVTWEHVAVLGGGSLFLLVGYYAGVEAMRVGEVGSVSPFRYTNLVWAIVLGFAIFGEIPDLLTWIGAAIIVLSGLYTLHRQRVRSGA